MLHYTLRRLLFAIPTLLVISFIIFALLDLSPGDPDGEPAADHPAGGARAESGSAWASASRSMSATCSGCSSSSSTSRLNLIE